MDWEVVKVGLIIVNMIGNFGIGVWLYLEKRGDKTNARIDSVETTLEAQGKQLAHLEAKAEGAPTHNDLGDLHDRVTAVANAMNSLAGEFAGVKTVLNLIHQHLLNRDKS